MKHMSMAAMKKESGPPRLPQLAEVRRVTGVADVVHIDRKMSTTGLYALDKITVRANAGPDDKRELLAKAKEDISKTEIEELESQGVRVLWIRETPGVPGMHGGLSSERNAGEPDPLYGTRVLPYLVVSRIQARSIANVAEQMPEPPAEKRYVPEMRDGPIMSMAMIGPGC